MVCVSGKWRACAIVAVVMLCQATPLVAVPSGVTFNKDVRPILAEHCLKCHGADERARKGKLRLDMREEAVAKNAIIPGRPEESELFQRILSADEDEVMPPPGEHKSLKPEQKEVLLRWIAEGAPYEKHWAFIPPVQPVVPSLESPEFSITSPIDALVLARLREWKLQPAPPASKDAWLRRVSFDLTGLPPTLEELDAFLADSSDKAHEKVVDRLLASPHYGERLALDWLDVTRYADTYGRHEDSDSATWPWRDWVIRAFQQNMPFNDFITWQTAGDMLPDATRDQKVATLFNRLTQQSNESGSREEEFRIEQVADRVHANGQVFLGLTMECARCHDHKYDPISTRDYYQMSAFFNNIDELGIYSNFTAAIPSPTLLLPDAAQERDLAALQEKMNAVERQIAARREEAKAEYAKWIEANGPPPSPLRPLAWYPLDEGSAEKTTPNVVDAGQPGTMRARLTFGPGRIGSAAFFKGDDELTCEGAHVFRRPDPFSFGIWVRPQEERDRATVVSFSRSGVDAGRGYELLLDHGVPEFALQHFFPGSQIRIRARGFHIPLNEWTHFTCTYDGSARAAGLRLYINGQPAEVEVVRDNLVKDFIPRTEWGDIDVEKTLLQIGGRYSDAGVRNCSLDDFQVFDHVLSEAEVLALAGHKEEPPSWGAWFVGLFSKRETPMQWLDWYLREKDEKWQSLSASLRDLRAQENEIRNHLLEVMVMKELPQRRATHVLHRGQWDAPGEEVQAGTPASVLPFSAEFSRDRLGFARWLVDARNPLTARVAVNRVWQMFFGRGLVGTPQDFGTRGESPEHAELLDWLAIHFRESGWDVKALCRLIALSSTYRQSGEPADRSLLERDPENKLLARGPRFRLSAEQLRDQALAVSGLLLPTVGGPSVRPYLPTGLYEQSGIQHAYNQQTGAAHYRRSLYTYWRRTLPPPNLAIFDAPTREVCRSRRETTNTPAQALVLMNDVQYVEAQRVLAEKLVKKHPQDDHAKLVEAFRLLTGCHPVPAQLEILQRLLAQERAEFTAKPEAAVEFCGQNGERPRDASLSAVEVAATASVVRALFSFQESVMKP